MKCLFYICIFLLCFARQFLTNPDENIRRSFHIVFSICGSSFDSVATQNRQFNLIDHCAIIAEH